MMEVIEIPEPAAILRLTSPAFTMRYPDIWHKDIVPEQVLKAMEVSWKNSYFPQRPVTFSCVRNVYVVEEGLVFDSDGRLLRETITQHTEDEIKRGHCAVLAAMQAQTPSISGPHVLCTKRGTKNYGHWLVEMLPKAFLARLYGLPPKVIVPVATGQLNTVIRDSLAMFSIMEQDVLRAGPDPIHFEELIVADGITAHGVYMSPLVLNCIDALAARVPGDATRQLFVCRTTMASRRLVDEDEVHRRARACGYRLIDTAQMSFAQQIAAFKNATEIVGVMGAALTNIAFSSRSATIANIAPFAMPDTFFWFIAGLRGQYYREIRAQQVGPIKGIAPWDTDILLQPADVDRLF